LSNHEKFLIGVDEAGYGPNLGPLVIAATVWKTSRNFTESEIGRAFSTFSAPLPWAWGCEHVPLGDSKELYRPSLGVIHLEVGLLAMLSPLTPDATQNLQIFINRFASMQQATVDVPAAPWYDSLSEFKVPEQADVGEITRLGQLAQQTSSGMGVELVAAKCLIASEGYFNQAVNQLGSKGQLLSQQSLRFVAGLVESLSGDAEIFCDRHGGRKNYLPLLLDAMPEHWFDETVTDRERCSYRNRSQARSLEIHFSVKGDRFPPTALASMLAKYVRERLMQSFNAFWRKHLPDLKPTAGYPSDARRFRAEMESTASQLGLPVESWWRCK
jgi:ribonuclease HII